MSDKIYLVERFWYDYESESHGCVAAFSTLAEAEDLRVRCQEWIDQYCEEFWNEYARRFVEPEERRYRYIWTKETAEEREYDELLATGQEPEVVVGNPGYDLAQDWFGRWGRGPDGREDPGVEPGLIRMQRLSPDPTVEILEGQACHYRVLVVPYGSTQPATYSVGPEESQQEFLARFCRVNSLAIEDVQQRCQVTRCLCGHLNYYGWKIEPDSQFGVKQINQHWKQIDVVEQP